MVEKEKCIEIRRDEENYERSYEKKNQGGMSLDL